MQLRNKKTGEIVVFGEGIVDLSQIGCKNVAEMIEAGWEDYEEPKHDYYFIRDGGNIDCHWYQKLGEITERRKEIGNYFETEEEAEKAVEKLKAWKRLRGKGFRFNTWYGGSKNISYEITSLENETYIPRQICDDLDLLFGGEE